MAESQTLRILYLIGQNSIIQINFRAIIGCFSISMLYFYAPLSGTSGNFRQHFE